MTSASELYCNRRFRIGRTAADGLDSTPAGTDLFSRCHSVYNRRAHQSRRRSDFDDCDPIRRSSSDVRQRSHRASQSQLENVTLRFDDGTSQTNATDNLNLETPSSVTSRTEIRRNERLPGAVLLARERLLHRLSGLSVSENRQQRRMPMPAHTEHLEDAETLIGWLARATPSTDRNSFVGLQTQKPTKPPGLTQKAVDCLHSEVFDKTGASHDDCSICLESFENGDMLVRLPCSHRFHSACLDPWVRTCGDCPYCRKGVSTVEGNERA